jgi:drug/metabolite transporter (DMT)-like permease
VSNGRTPRFAFLAGTILFLQMTASMCYPVARYGLQFIEPFTFAFYRFCISSIALLIATQFTKRQPPIERGDWPRIILMGITIIPFNQTLFLIGQSLTGASHGAFLFATTPVWIFILALFILKEPFQPRRAGGFALAMAGVVTIMLSGGLQVSTEYLLGDLIILLAVIAWAVYTVLGKPLVRKYGAIRLTAYAISIGSLLYFPFGLYRALNFDYSAPPLAAWGSVAYMALAMSLLVYVLWYFVLKYMEASRLAVWHNIQPVIASTVAFVWLHEPITLPFIAGGTMVLIGVIIAEVRSRGGTGVESAPRAGQ